MRYETALSAVVRVPRRSPWSGFLAVSFALFVLLMSATLPTALYSAYAARYAFGSGVLTLLFAAFVAGILAVLLAAGNVADRVGHRPVLLAAVAIAVLASVLLAIGGAIAVLFVARFLAGAAIGLGVGASTAALAELHPRGDREQAALASTVLNVLGQAFGALFGGVFGQWLPCPLHLVWIAHAGLLAVAFVLLWRLPGAARPRGTAWLRLQPLAVPAEMRALFAADAFGTFAMGAVLGLYSALTPTFLHSLLHLSSLALAGAITFLLMSVSAATQLALRRLDSRKSSVIGLLIDTTGIILVTVAATIPALWLLLAGTVLAGVGQGLTFKGLLATVSTAAPAGRQAEVISSFYVAAWLGAALPTLGIGYAAPELGLLTPVKLFTVMIAVLALAATAGLLKTRT